MAFGLGVVGGLDHVGVAVVGSGCGFGHGSSLGVARRGPSPLLAEGLVGGAAGWSTCLSWWCFLRSFTSPGGEFLGSLGFPVFCAFVVRAVLALLCVVCVCVACVGGGRGGVCCVGAGVCAVCWWCIWVPALASLGLGWRLCVAVGAVCSGPLPALAVGPGCGSAPFLAGVCWWWCVPPPPPLRAPPPFFFWLRRLACSSPGALSGTTRAVVGLRWGWLGGGGP